MRLRNIIAVLLVLSVGLVVGFAEEKAPAPKAEGEMIDNPQYKSWAKFKPGAMCKAKMTSDAGGQKNEMIMIATLKELSADKAVVESEMIMTINGKETKMPAQKMEIPAKIKKVAPPKDAKDAPKLKTGEEEVEVAGKKFKCKWTETVMKTPNGTVTSKVWTCDDIPGGTAKTISKMEGKIKGTTTIEVVEYKTGK